MGRVEPGGTPLIRGNGSWLRIRASTACPPDEPLAKHRLLRVARIHGVECGVRRANSRSSARAPPPALSPLSVSAGVVVPSPEAPCASSPRMSASPSVASLGTGPSHAEADAGTSRRTAAELCSWQASLLLQTFVDVIRTLPRCPPPVLQNLRHFAQGVSRFKTRLATPPTHADRIDLKTGDSLSDEVGDQAGRTFFSWATLGKFARGRTLLHSRDCPRRSPLAVGRGEERVEIAP
jgi:hypothetical protein